MKKADQKKVISAIVLIALVIIIFLVYVIVRVSPSALPTNSITAVSPTVGAGTVATNSSKTWSAVSASTPVPGEGQTPASPNIAVPDAVLSASIGSDANFRLFHVTVQNSAFSPDTIIARQGDTVRILFTALDKNYDFIQPDKGLSSNLPKGVEKIVEFSGVVPGKFTFYCASCGGPDKGPVGYIVVVPKK